MKKCALLFGLNYAHCKSGELRGCINDVKMMTDFLKNELDFTTLTSYTDDVSRHDTSKAGILKHLNAIADNSWREDIDVVWIHFSGHGSYMEDTTGDEDDGQDECLVPSDYETTGFIKDDDINRIFGMFNPHTRVICVFDCCHSGTMADLKYGFDENRTVSIENTNSKAQGHIITLSGCKDEQTSADAYGVAGQNQFSGAMTACLLEVLKDKATHADIFLMMQRLHAQLIERRFTQRPLVNSTHDLREDPVWIPRAPVAPTPVPASSLPPLARITQPLIPVKVSEEDNFDDLNDDKWKQKRPKDSCACCVQ